MKRFPLMFGILLLTLALPSHAIREDCTDGLTSDLPVTFEINIPSFIYFQVGRVDEQEEVTFDLTDEFPASGYYHSSTMPQGHTNIEAASTHGNTNKGELDVVVKANCGTVKISYDVSDNQGLVGDNSQYVSYETIKTTSSDTAFPAPVLNNQADQFVELDVTSYGAVTDRAAKWIYKYTNNEVPMAGTYTGVVTYQAVCP